MTTSTIPTHAEAEEARLPRVLALVAALAAVVGAGAIFGFFYAWVCSTMWGLDATDPRTAIAAMQAMNASVRNPVFAAAFFGSAPVTLLAAALAWGVGRRRAAALYGAAALLYIVGGVALTMTYNVRLNETLAGVAVPHDVDEARAIWREYSGAWQVGNIIRTVVSGVSLVGTTLGVVALVAPQRGRARDRTMSGPAQT